MRITTTYEPVDTIILQVLGKDDNFIANYDIQIQVPDSLSVSNGNKLTISWAKLKIKN